LERVAPRAIHREDKFFPTIITTIIKSAKDMKGKELSRKTQPQCCHPKRPQAGKIGAKNRLVLKGKAVLYAPLEPISHEYNHYKLH
jgi:hypothetical protein